MTYPIIAAGSRLPPAKLNPPPWSSYGPGWSATTTNPSIGNGSVAGRWRYLDPSVVEIAVVIRPGTTTSFGSGTYRLNLPVDAVAGGPDPLIQGVGLFGGALYRFVGWANTSSTPASFVTLYRDNSTSENLTAWSPTAPVTFAAGHSVSFNGTYRVAW
ncbi:hypothetical protein [Micromonospora sp. WMMD737]|uniref:hypothetical protein n=1 Tax=Micromonospora sp. WMMD737 TaxID=3404113 RepID=UPI003B94FFFE